MIQNCKAAECIFYNEHFWPVNQFDLRKYMEFNGTVVVVCILQAK